MEIETKYYVVLLVAFGFLFGVFVGMLIQNMLFVEQITAFFNAVRIENFTLNLDINQTKLVEVIMRLG